MATPNYSYEKRQRELAKKRKAEEKKQRKLERTEPAAVPAGVPSEGGAPADPASPADAGKGDAASR